MNEIVEKELELRKSSLINGENLLIYPHTGRNYNLKEQLENLIGPADFSYRLEAVNLIIGIILSSLLLLFFFL